MRSLLNFNCTGKASVIPCTFFIITVSSPKGSGWPRVYSKAFFGENEIQRVRAQVKMIADTHIH